MQVTAQMVKELRERTGAGMMDCKSALAETQGDMEKAVDLLRKKGLAAAAKKAGRVAAEGIVHVRPGRPRKGTETGPTEPRSIRFPAPVWKLLEARAKSQGLTLHSALRAAIIDWARRA